MQYRRMISNVLVVATDQGYDLTLETRHNTYKAVVAPKTVTTGWLFKKTTAEKFGASEKVLRFAGYEFWVTGPKEAAIVFETLVRQQRYQAEQQRKKSKPGLFLRLLAALKG